ncbi:MAG: 1-deoxy-D-xylulose-5-phosphate reductoisomerase [Coriobacteriia bacterium]|nr:1-deoxy-D-xylulose-5-phosphate reductoisomerase [Coriobacteriia bacterium]
MTTRLAILGSTGSIGRQALDVAARYPDRIEVVALAANTDVDTIIEQARTFGVRDVALADSAAAEVAASWLGASGSTSHNVEAGPEAVASLAAHPDVDIVLNALVGAAGLRATVTALAAGKTLALANKESLVVGGELVTALAAPGQILPVDSEHSAIFQCLEGDDTHAVARIWLTASGGPFRGATRDRLASVTAAEALTHPTWTMGPKITIDSATLMNKGLEVIEAHHLFGTPFDDITVVVHPQSCVHSMVEFTDGSVKAHLGATDMRIPIQYALSYPQRWDAPLPPVDFRTLGSLEFAAPDTATFGCLELACAAGRAGGTLPAVLNAANEVAVAAFLGGRCGFLNIEETVRAALEGHDREPLESLEQIEAVDAQARRFAEETLKRL